MVTNAPYYQLRGSQLESAPNGTNATSQFVPDDNEYDLSPSAAINSSLDHLQTSVYPESSARQASMDNALEENHHLAELLEAATTAQTMTVSDTDAATTVDGKRKRASQVPDNNSTDYEVNMEPSTKKQRIVISTDPHLVESVLHLHDDAANIDTSPLDESFSNDAPTASVHSAAALFRPCSESTSRKHTRPPMSKLFISLQLSPESFLQLQAEAKAYMLDLGHPERQNCVGNRGKGDTDMVKLRLFNCVRDFLNNGAGEKFFGEHVKKPDKKDTIDAARVLKAEQTPVSEQRLTWPVDGNKIISVVTPLMRRMVTNERQRQYAIETRKSGTKKKEKELDANATSFQGASHSLALDGGHPLQPSLDPSLSQMTQLTNTMSLSPRSETMTDFKSFPETCIAHPGRFGTDVASSGSTVFDSKLLTLPLEGQIAPHLSSINIFLALAACGPRPDIKLDEMRISLQPSQSHLACYEWEKFLHHVITMLKKAKVKNSESQTIHTEDQENHASTVNLRGLAAAANALSSTNTNKRTPTPDIASRIESSPLSHLAKNSNDGEIVTEDEDPITEPSASSSSEDAPPILLPPATSMSSKELASSTTTTGSETKLRPHYIIKTISPEGWRIIANAKDWHDMLMQKAFALWADGVCNVIIELTGLPALNSLPMASSTEGVDEQRSEVVDDEVSKPIM